MRSARRLHLLLAAGALGLGLGLPTTAAATSIALDPADQTAQVGDVVSVDVVFDGLAGEIVSAYDLDVTYDAAVLAATGVSFTTALGDELSFEVLSDFDLATPGVVDFAQLSLLTDGALFALQGGDTVTVATLSFAAVGVGTSDLGFVFDPVNQVTGRNAALLDVAPGSASITVARPGAAVPEPTAALLFSLGLLAVAPGLRGRRAGPWR